MTREREGGGRWVPGTHQGSEMKIGAQGESEEKDLNVEEGGSKQCFLCEPWLTEHEGQLEPAETW